MDEPIDWRAAAAEYRRRLHAICTMTALALYAALGFACGKAVEWMHIDSVWTETIAMVAWLPMGIVAWYFKARLERWADSKLPTP